MDSVNDLLFSEHIRHQVALAGYNNNVVARIIALLNRSDVRLYAELQAALERLPPSSFTVERLESLLGSVRATNSAAYEQMGRELTDELRSFAQYEAAYQAQALQSVLPVSVHVASVSTEVAYAAAMARPFQGVLLREVLKDLEEARAKKVRQVVSQGFVEGKTTDQIIRELRGTKAKGYADGLMEGPRRDIEAVARTALGHMTGTVQDKTAEANVDLIKAVRWSSTLDLRTSPICRPRDGKLYEPVSHKPVGHLLSWLSGPGRAHWRCRSAQVFVLKSYAELGINAPEVVVNGRTRASMDGQLPADTTYAEWLAKQSANRQDEVLGPTRGKLLREGNLPIERMYSQKGDFLTLDQLRERDAGAFKRAGL